MTERGERWLIRGTVGVLVVTLLVLGWTNRDRFVVAENGNTAPDFTFPTLTGDTVSLADLRGQVVLLNIWATWCTPCVREMPALENLYRELHDDGLEILAVSVDASAGVFKGGGDVGAFVNEFGLTFPILLNPSGDIQTAYGVNGLPTSFVIDKQGRVRQKLLGAVAWDDPEYIAALRALLES